jgi:hypothetical protein
MPEHRKIVKRWDLLLFLPVIELSSGDIIGNIADLTTEGMLLFSKTPMPLHHDLTLEIRHEDLENSLLNNDLPLIPIRFIAQTRWCIPEGDLYRSGMQFHTLAPDVQRIIRLIVRNIARNFS